MKAFQGKVKVMKARRLEGCVVDVFIVKLRLVCR